MDDGRRTTVGYGGSSVVYSFSRKRVGFRPGIDGHIGLCYVCILCIAQGKAVRVGNGDTKGIGDTEADGDGLLLRAHPLVCGKIKDKHKVGHGGYRCCLPVQWRR